MSDHRIETAGVGRAATQPGSQGSAPQPPAASSPAGADPSRTDPRKAYLLGKLDERKDICRYLDVRAVRAVNHWHSLPRWAFIRRAKMLWAISSASITAKEIEQGHHLTDQAVWVVEIKDGLIVGREAFIRDSDRSGKADKTQSGLAVGESADPKGIAQPSTPSNGEPA